MFSGISAVPPLFLNQASSVLAAVSDESTSKESQKEREKESGVKKKKAG